MLWYCLYFVVVGKVNVEFFVFVVCFSGDDYYIISGMVIVDGICGCIFQDLNRFDIVGVDVVDIIGKWEIIYNIQWFSVGFQAKCINFFDVDSRCGIWLFVRSNRNVSNVALYYLGYIVGGLFFYFFGVYNVYCIGKVFFMLCVVIYYYYFFQQFGRLL